ncbi:hypothetical protein H4R20_000700 [Coemansia guatemalensis]|uniref:Uncharacterized protein n=1 Tax=Coemansia guatemalensis TaxID=2761395 RepID=A0A9W8I0N5_9FUNG|nr:hypothetical protein H4R20_000700 [Coemansia guatemalensis]
MRQTGDRGRRTNNSSLPQSSRRNRQPARQLSGRPAPDLQMIASSDSDDIQCVTPFSQTRKLSRQHSMPTATVSKAVRAASAAGALASSTQPQTVTRPVHHVVLDTDEDEDDFVEARPVRNNKRSGSSDMRPGSVDVPEDSTNKASKAATTAPKRARLGRPQRMPSADLMSSPSLLRASSPTIQRFNSNSSTVVVLAGNTQDLSGQASSTLPPMETLTGSTAVGLGLSAGSDAIPPSSPPADCIPETPRQSPERESPLSMAAVLQKTASADLSSDPISEFGSQTNSPLRPKISRQVFNAQHHGQLQSRNAEPEPGCIGDDSPGTEGGMDQTSVTQWYHNNLFQDDQDELERLDERSSGADSVEAVSDGGYSSPLEGFWDLRNDAPESTFDRELYMNQFEPTARQRANRRRREARQMTQTQTTAHNTDGGAAAPLPPPPPPSTGRGGRGRGGNARGGFRRNAHAGAAGRRRGSAIRPAHSTRVAGPPRARPPAPAAYNYYADDPFLDVVGSIGWEGGGTRRFG